jgi:hypothetical protein
MAPSKGKPLQSSSVFAHWSLCVALQHGWVPLRPSDSNYGELLAWDQGDSPTLSTYSQEVFRCMNHRQCIPHLAFDKPDELHWWKCGVEDFITIIGLILHSKKDLSWKYKSTKNASCTSKWISHSLHVSRPFSHECFYFQGYELGSVQNPHYQ